MWSPVRATEFCRRRGLPAPRASTVTRQLDSPLDITKLGMIGWVAGRRTHRHLPREYQRRAATHPAEMPPGMVRRVYLICFVPMIPHPPRVRLSAGVIETARRLPVA